MGKRKRGAGGQNSHENLQKPLNGLSEGRKEDEAIDQRGINGVEKQVGNRTIAIQIVVGTYEKILHGVIATLEEGINDTPSTESHASFADTFLFTAHDSAIRCLALSPPSREGNSKKRFLASGSSDSVVNLYQLSSQPPVLLSQQKPSPPTSLAGANVAHNSGNRELGSLQHHAGGINVLSFPTRSKLMSAAEDCTIAVTRTRDWTMLSTIKTPMAKAHGRPSGDTAPLGGVPAGVNDFAIHPSMKLMVSVSKGEKCMRLWNLVTGKKAGVLNFDKSSLDGVGESKWAKGEGRKVRWNAVGEEYAVAFERGCLVYGLDSHVKALVLPKPSTKVHQLRYVALDPESEDSDEVLAISTEDGRIVFYNTKASTGETEVRALGSGAKATRAISQLGGKAEGLLGRIKDFEILRMPNTRGFFVVSASSDGAVRIWSLGEADLNATLKRITSTAKPREATAAGQVNGAKFSDSEIPQVGQLMGVYETGNRITCLSAFVMSDGPEASLD